MTNEKAEKILFYHRSTGNLSPMLNEALDLAISALSKQSASGKQANESVIVNFVAFQRKWLKAHKIMELNSADEVMTEIFLKETGKAFINSLSQSVENDEDGTTDDHIADSDKMVDQFRGITKKTNDVSISKQEVLTNIRKLCDGCYLMEHCGQCNPECRLRQAIDMIEESSSVPMIPKKPSENGESEMNSMDEWWKNYIRSRMSQDDVPDIRVGKIPYKKPEIIHCTECKKCWYSGTATINGQSCRIFRCSVWERPVSPFGYCYMAKRRNDG